MKTKTSITGFIYLGNLVYLTVFVLLAGCNHSSNRPDSTVLTIGGSGGTVTGGGAQVVVPAGALNANTAIAVTQSSSGAPALPAGLQSVGQMFAFTPHGTVFTTPVTLTVSFNSGSVPAGMTPSLYKTNAQGSWIKVANATITSNANGSSMSGEATSFSFALVVVGEPAPLITQSPQDQSVTEGATANFSVTAIGTPPFTYVWQRSDDAGLNWIEVGTASTFTTSATVFANDNNDRYRVIVSNIGGDTTSAIARLTVTQNAIAPTITTHPANVAVQAPTTATFSVAVVGTAPFTYQWERSNDGGINYTAIGVTTASYTTAATVAGDNNARFRVVVSNTAGSVTSTAAILNVTTAPPPVTPGTKRFSAGNGFSVAVNAQGVPYRWGARLDEGPPVAADRAPTVLNGINSVQSVSAGSSSSVALVRTDGTVWAMGYRGSIDCNFGSFMTTPTQIPGATNITAASMGSSHTLLLKSDGTVMAFGCNNTGELGRAGITPSASAIPVTGLSSIVAVAAGARFSLALDSNGLVYSWGGGTLGDGSGITGSRFTPTVIANLTNVTAISAGQDFALALRSDGSVWAWGQNSNGKLGDGTMTRRNSPVATLLTSNITAIAADSEYAIALRNDGIVMSWGINETGQLGSGSSSPGFRVQPLEVVGLTNVTAISAGGPIGHALVQRSDGSIWSWGDNFAGQLGDNTTTFRTAPVQVLNLNLN